MSDQREVVIVSGVRTAIGGFNGSLSSVPATTLGSVVITEAIRRAGIGKEDVDEVIMGIVLPAGLGQNPARQAMLHAGLPYDVGALSVNKVCGSGLKAVMVAAQAIASGDADVVIAGGMENMDRAPYYLLEARTGYRLWDGKVVDGMVRDGLWDVIGDFHMGYATENVAEKFEVSRGEQDRFAAASYEKTLSAMRAGKFKEEIVAVEVPQPRGEPKVFDTDEIPRETTIDSLARLKPTFKDGGSITAGNASKIADGAAAVVLMSRQRADALGVQPIARIVAQGAAGIEPELVTAAPVNSIPKVLKKAGLKEKDIDLHEINEAFAASTLAVLKELRIDESKVNVNGGAVALGHPIGASGARLLVSLLSAMRERDTRRGMASVCLGGGEAVSMIVER